MENKIVVPAQDKKITLQNGKFNAPKNPIIPYIEGGGISVDVTPAILKVVDATVERAYKDERKISWMEIYTDGKPTQVHGQDVQLPAETLDLVREYRVATKGSLTIPAGSDIRSLNVALRQELGPHICLRSVRYYRGTPSPVRHPELTDVVTFRENSEDIYVGIEWEIDSADAERVIKFLREKMGVKKIRFPEHCSIGTRPCSEEDTKCLVRAAIEYTIASDRSSVTLVRKGNIMKPTEGAFEGWGYRLAREELGGELIDGGPWLKVKDPNTGKETVVKDVIADIFLQQILLRPAEYDVIACMNLGGDYVSDALAARVGDIGIAPGANIGGECALFEATHGTVSKYVGQDKVNPGPTILSAEVVSHHMDWTEAADLIVKGMGGAIDAKAVTHDLERLMEGTKLLKCSESGDAIIGNM